MEFVFKAFKNLTVDELYDLLQLRSAVFVVEQTCIYQDMDDKDKKAMHLLGYNNGKLVAYARVLAPGISYKEASIGRVVVDGNNRGKSYGRVVMRKAINYVPEEFNTNEIVISAQYYLLKFYSELGFVAEDEIYLEDNIPHIKMRYKCL